MAALAAGAAFVVGASAVWPSAVCIMRAWAVSACGTTREVLAATVVGMGCAAVPEAAWAVATVPAAWVWDAA